MSNFSINAKARGILRVQKIDVDTGEVYFDTGEFNNTILNLAFTQGGLGPTFTTCWCSTDSVVNESDTTLTGPLGSTTSVTSAVTVTNDGTVVTQTQIRTFAFAAGTIVGNMSAIGINGTASNSNMFIKSLIKDVNGDPTTISVGAADQVIVTHKLITTWNQYTHLGTFNIDGVDYIAELYNTTGFQQAYFSPYPQRVSVSNNTYSFSIHNAFTPPTLPVAPTETSYVTGLGAAYNTVNGGTPLTNTGVIGEIERYWNYTVAANVNINTNDPIVAVSLRHLTNSYSCAIKFTPPLPKNSAIAYTFRFGLKLARA